MNSSARKLLAVTLLFAVEALHLQSPTPEGQPDDGETPQDQPGAELTHTEVEHLPDLDDFWKIWSSMAPQPAEVVPSVPGVQLVMGVFTSSAEVLYRSIVRATWMKQQGVCKALEGPKEGCGVYVTFAQGQNRTGIDTSGFEQQENDIAFLPVRENMNFGKTLDYFRFALQQYPWATHLGKMDMDVVPKWRPIVQGLGQLPGDCETYVGRPWDCQQFRYCPDYQCGPPRTDGLFRALDSNDTQTCWSYMQGGLYIMSKNLLTKATEYDGYWQEHHRGPEDALAGKAVVHASNRHNLCVRTWPQELTQFGATHFHYNQPWGICDTAAWAAYYHCASRRRTLPRGIPR